MERAKVMSPPAGLDSVARSTLDEPFFTRRTAIWGAAFPYDAIGRVPAALLALTPAHFIFAREARDFICVLPFALGWLWCLLVFLETDRTAFAAFAGAILGAAVYTHISAWLFMPMYAVFTLAAMAVE